MKTLMLVCFGIVGLIACDGGSNGTTKLLDTDGNVGVFDSAGIPVSTDAADGDASDVRLGMVLGDGATDSVLDVRPDMATEDSAKEDAMPDVREPDVLESDMFDVPPVAGDIRTHQIFPGLCCGQPGVGCQNTVTRGACCPSSMTSVECQAMWGTEDWCYCGEGFDCYWFGTATGLNQQWQCQHKH